MTNYKNKSYRKAVGPIKIGGLLNDVTKETFRKRGFAEAKLITDWEVVVGKELAKYSSPIKISFPKGKRESGTLHIRIFGSLATEMQHMEPMIIEKIATYFGYKAVSSIKLKHENIKSSKPERKDKTIKKTIPIKDIDFGDNLNDIKDKKLRAALEVLGRSVHIKAEEQ
jgi:hypothetical protein